MCPPKVCWFGAYAEKCVHASPKGDYVGQGGLKVGQGREEEPGCEQGSSD